MSRQNSPSFRSLRRRPARLGLAIALLAGLAACGRTLPPNVTPPGETAAASDPGPPEGLGAQKETSK